MDETQVTEDPNLQEEVQTGEEETEDGGLVGATLFDSLYAAAEGEEAEVSDGGQAVTDSLSGEAQQQPQAEEEPQAEAEPKKKVKRIHKKEVIDPDLPEEESSEGHEPVSESDDDEEFLLPEEREQLKVVKHISNKNNTNQDKELKEYFRKQKEYIEKRLEENPDLNLSDDHDFEQFVARNRPQLDMAEVRAAEREMLLDEAEERALKRLRPEVEKTNIETRRLQIKPKVEEEKQKAEQKAMSMVPEFLADDLKNRSPEDVQKDNPYEFNIVNTAVTNASRFASTFLDISKGMVDYDPHNPEHDQLRDWLVKEQDAFINGGQTKDQQGRPFMRRERYLRLSSADQQKYWTWTDDQCVDIMYARAKTTMESELEQQNKAMQACLSRNGQQRPQAAPAQAAPTPPAPKPTPRAGGTPQAQTQDQVPSPLSVLGM